LGKRSSSRKVGRFAGAERRGTHKGKAKNGVKPDFGPKNSIPKKIKKGGHIEGGIYDERKLTYRGKVAKRVLKLNEGVLGN